MLGTKTVTNRYGRPSARWRLALENRSLIGARHRVIAATPALRERELAKEAALGGVVAGARRARGSARAQRVKRGVDAGGEAVTVGLRARH